MDHFVALGVGGAIWRGEFYPYFYSVQWKFLKRKPSEIKQICFHAIIIP
jgi:hypothetical protein